MANLAAFRSSIRTGLVRPNNFRVDLAFPAFVGGGIEAAQLGQFHCKSASLPDSSIAAVPVYFRGRAIHVAGEREFQPWTVAVYNENFEVRNAFENWMNGINNLLDNTGIVEPAVYGVDMGVVQLDRAGNSLKEYSFQHVFPIAISPVQLDFEANNQVEIFEVTFRYDTYTSSGVNGNLGQF